MIKRPRIEIPKILAAAKGEACTLNFNGCLGKHPSVVACHSPYHQHGKGMGNKSHDIFVAFGCQHCHDILDGRKHIKPDEWAVSTDIWAQFKWNKFHDGMAETQIRLIEKGVLK